jgi:hypothetical protein
MSVAAATAGTPASPPAAVASRAPPLGHLFETWRDLLARAPRTLLWLLPCVAAGVAAALPVIDSTIKAVHAGWVPAGDDGIITTRAWDVLTSHTPLVGQYSEAGLVVPGQVLHSPGPLLYWLLALPARFGSVQSIAVTMGAVNTLAIVGCVILARRRGGVFLMLATALGIALMCRSLPAEAMHDVWNPAAGLFPFLLLIFVGWSLACGDRRLLPLAALLASYVTQTHLMYAAPTAVLALVAIGGLTMATRARRREASRRRARPPRVWPWAASAVVVLALCWLPPVLDELENNPGNLTQIVRTVEHRGPTLGDATGWHAVVRSVGVPAWWLHEPASEWERKFDVRRSPGRAAVDSAIAILAALVLVGVAGLLARRRDLAAAAAIGLGLCAAIGLQAASNPAGRLFAETLGYTMWWGSQLGLWVWLVLVWAAWLGLAALVTRALARRRGRAGGRTRTAAVLGVSLAGAAGVLAVGASVAATARPDSHVYDYRAIATTADRLERAIPAGETIAYHLGPLDVTTQPMEPAIRFLLVRHGDRVLADGSYPRLGSYYVQGRRPVQWTVYLTDARRGPAGMALAARVHVLGPFGRATLNAWLVRDTTVHGRGAEVAERARARVAATPG